MKGLFNFFQARELVKPCAPRANFSDRLGAAEHEHTNRGQFRRAQVQVVGDVFVFRDAAGAAIEDISKILFAQAVEGLFDFGLAEHGDRIPIVLLVTGQGQRVERQRIILRRRDLLFDQRAEDADFVRG